MIIVKYLKKSGLFITGLSETVKNEVKNQKGKFLSMLLGTLSASLFGNLLRVKGVKRLNSFSMLGLGVIEAGEGTFRVLENF